MKKIFLFPVLGLCSLFLLAGCSKQSIPQAQAPAPQPAQVAKPTTPAEQPAPATGANNTTGTKSASKGIVSNLPENQKQIGGKITRIGTNTFDVEFKDIEKVLVGENAPLSHEEFTALSIDEQNEYSKRMSDVTSKVPNSTITVTYDTKTQFFATVLGKPGNGTGAAQNTLGTGTFNDLKQGALINVLGEIQGNGLKALKVNIFPAIPDAQGGPQS